MRLRCVYQAWAASRPIPHSPISPRPRGKFRSWCYANGQSNGSPPISTPPAGRGQCRPRAVPPTQGRRFQLWPGPGQASSPMVARVGRFHLREDRAGVPGPTVSGQLPFVSHMSARPKQSVPELEPTRSRPDPDPLPVETQPEGVPTCPRHNAKLVPSTKKVGSFHCPARDPVQPRGWCTFVLTPIDAPAGVNPGTLTVDVNVDESPGDAGAGDGITPGGPLDSYRRRHGGRLPWETDPHVDSSFGGDPTTA